MRDILTMKGNKCSAKRKDNLHLTKLFLLKELNKQSNSIGEYKAVVLRGFLCPEHLCLIQIDKFPAYSHPMMGTSVF